MLAIWLLHSCVTSCRHACDASKLRLSISWCGGQVQQCQQHLQRSLHEQHEAACRFHFGMRQQVSCSVCDIAACMSLRQLGRSCAASLHGTLVGLHSVDMHEWHSATLVGLVSKHVHQHHLRLVSMLTISPCLCSGACN